MEQITGKTNPCDGCYIRLTLLAIEKEKNRQLEAVIQQLLTKLEGESCKAKN